MTSSPVSSHQGVARNASTPFVLVILDGWGYSENQDFNAIALGNTPHWDRVWRESPHALISGSGRDVGLPEGQMGNSEVGHMTLGAGRVIRQDLSRISEAIADESFFSNTQLSRAVNDCKLLGGSVHIFGLLSDGGVHSHEDHIKAAIDLAFREGADSVYLHAFLDGRDVPPSSASAFLVAAEECIRTRGNGGIATIMGRFYAMDRDNRWDRTQLAYDALTGQAVTFQANTAQEALANAYERGETDEFVQPTAIRIEGQTVSVADNDCVIFMNFRADRARQLTRAFVEHTFDAFSREIRPRLCHLVSLTRYADDIASDVAFEPLDLSNSLGECLSAEGKTQLRLAETEKYAHVTFFFSCGREALFEGEDRILIPSPRVTTYDLAPEMSAKEVTRSLVSAITSGKYDLIICNFANGDMVGHTGKLNAAIKAVECLDTCIGEIAEAITSSKGQCLITADHGNVEKMKDSESNQPHTAHTSELVPLVYLGDRITSLVSMGGTLSDIAPTILDLMELPQPQEMTGKSLAKRKRSKQESDEH